MSPNSAIKRCFFSFFLSGQTSLARKRKPVLFSLGKIWYPYCIASHHGFTEFHQLDTFYNALNPTDQDSLNSAAGGNLLERSTQDVLTIYRINYFQRSANFTKNKSIVSQVKSSDVNYSSSFEIAKLTHAVNQQTSVVTTVMTAILKQFQATPPPASVKAVEEICVTCGGAHPYYQCLTADGNTFLEFQDNIQGYVSAVAVNYNQVINPLSGNPTPISEPVTKSSSSPTLTSFEKSDLIWEEFEAYPASDLFPPGNDDPVDLLLEEFTDELTLITFPSGNDDLPFDIESILEK
ncbi:hypothetical protein Tco_1060735 [Tanacetum coccineum]